MKTILVVEDDHNQQLLYEQELTDDGYSVILARNGREATQKVQESPPDLIILDIGMPGMNGIETLNRILIKNNTLPVILNTAYSIYTDNFMSWVADAYVIKSSDLTELKIRIREVLDKREQRK